jgi:hypothetical protein
MTDNSEFTYNKCKSLDFNIGDRFHEMFSFWVCIIDITEEDHVITLEGHPSNALNMVIKKQTREELFKRLKYTSLDACHVSYSDTSPDTVSGWLRHYKNEMVANGKADRRGLELSLMFNDIG